MLVELQVLGEIGNALGEQCDLDLRGARVTLMGSVLSDDVLLFFSRQCHGIGLSVHEPPDCSAACHLIAQPGMVFSIEPGIYLGGKFGVRIEDLVAVTEDGGETLNALDRELQVIDA